MAALEYRDELDIAQVLLFSRQALIAAWPAGLPTGMFTREEVDKIEALRAIGSVLGEDLHLCRKFRLVAENVLAGRDIAELTGADCRPSLCRQKLGTMRPFAMIGGS